jgi:hypothetical protein
MAMIGDVEEICAALGGAREALRAGASAEQRSKLVETGRLLVNNRYPAVDIKGGLTGQDGHEELRSEEGGTAAKRQLGKQLQEHSQRAGMESPEAPSHEPAEAPVKPPFREKWSQEQKRVARGARLEGKFAQHAQFAYTWMHGLEKRSFQGQSFPGEQSFRDSGLLSKEQIEKIDAIYFDFTAALSNEVGDVPNPRELDEWSAPRLIDRFEMWGARDRADRA